MSSLCSKHQFSLSLAWLSNVVMSLYPVINQDAKGFKNWFWSLKMWHTLLVLKAKATCSKEASPNLSTDYYKVQLPMKWYFKPHCPKSIEIREQTWNPVLSTTTLCLWQITLPLSLVRRFGDMIVNVFLGSPPNTLESHLDNEIHNVLDTLH